MKFRSDKQRRAMFANINSFSKKKKIDKVLVDTVYRDLSYLDVDEDEDDIDVRSQNDIMKDNLLKSMSGLVDISPRDARLALTMERDYLERSGNLIDQRKKLIKEIATKLPSPAKSILDERKYMVETPLSDSNIKLDISDIPIDAKELKYIELVEVPDFVVAPDLESSVRFDKEVLDDSLSFLEDRDDEFSSIKKGRVLNVVGEYYV